MKDKDNNYVIVSDSSCDLPDELIKENNIKVVPFYVSLDGNDYLKERVNLQVRDFYEKMVNESNLNPKTTLPSVADYEDVFEEQIKAGNSIICVCITSKFSGSYNSASVAKENCLEKYPNAKITVIDSMVNTGVQGLLVLEIARMKRDGKTYDEAIKLANAMRKTGRIFFTVGNLEYLRKGGRIGKLVGIVGATLKIKPIIVLRDGEIFSAGISFTRKKSFLKATDAALNYFKENKENPDDYQFITGYGYDIEEGKLYNEKLKEILKREDVLLIQIGATIGVHTGPYPLGVGFIKKYDRVKSSWLKRGK
ncbi:MAG: DegV family protein [Bacilli bacterium]